MTSETISIGILLLLRLFHDHFTTVTQLGTIPCMVLPLFCIPTLRVAEVGSLSSKAKMVMKIFVKRVFTIVATNASFLRVIANLKTQLSIICKIYHVIVHFLPKETLFLTQKGTFLPEDFHKVPKSRKNSECSGLKFLPESKLFGIGPSCLRTTFATLPTLQPFLPILSFHD